MNIGKIFENNIKSSMPDYVMFHRLPDSAQAFGDSKKLRFSIKNPFDFFLWDSERQKIYALELKTVKKKSISFERNKGESGDIHYHQIEGLRKYSRYRGMNCGFIIEFREIEKTIYLEINEFMKIFDNIDKKSFTFSDLDKYECDYIVIPQFLKKVNYTYDVEAFLART